MDHCFLGSAEESAAANPFLIIYDDHSGSLYAVAVASKQYEDCLADYLKAILDELGYAGTRVAIKCDNAPELVRLRAEVTARRQAPTIPIAVPVKESKGNGAVERAVRTWQGQFRTLKDHVEYEVKSELGPRHPLLTWCAWWAAALLNRVVVQPNGRSVYELSTGHRSKVPLAAFGEKLHWRAPRAVSGAGKFESEWEYGIFLGISGSEVVLGTATGIVRSRDVRRVAEAECWDRALMDDCKTSFKTYLVPEAAAEEAFEIPVIHLDPQRAAEIPRADVGGGSRRMMLRPSDFRAHGYTAGCPGCIELQTTGLTGSRRHSEVCRARIEGELIKTPEGRHRKDREKLRRDVEFAKAIAEEEERQRARAQAEPARASTDPVPPVPAVDPEFDDLLRGFDDDDDDNAADIL